MYSNDGFSRWMEIHIDEVNEDSVVLSCRITQSMTNGFQLAHGGILFSLCDSALAFHSNSFGNKAVTVESSINLLSPVFLNNIITAKSEIVKIGKTLGHFLVHAFNQQGKQVAIFKGTVCYTGELWE